MEFHTVPAYILAFMFAYAGVMSFAVLPTVLVWWLIKNGYRMEK